MFEVKDVSLSFNKVSILEHINIQFEQGKIHAIIGGNGAGKSSLMKVLDGQYDYQTGKLYRDGVEVKDFHQDIAFVTQEVDEALFQDLTVYDNLTRYDMTKGFFYRKKRKEEIQALLNHWQVEVDVDALVSTLSLSKKQLLLIILAILQNKQLLILDEPTASLSHFEVSRFFKELNQLKQHISIVFISHRIQELLQISDEITVLSKGSIVSSKPTSQWDFEQLSELITEGIAHIHENASFKTNEKAIDIYVSKNHLKDIHITANKGEIVGIAGLVGSGKTTIADYIFNHFKGTPAYVPEERHKHGLVLDHDINDNVQWINPSFFTNKKKEALHTKNLSTQVALKYRDIHQQVQTLSGGNQQKVVILRGLNKNANIFIFDEPTIGIDIGAKRDVFKLIHGLAKEGKTVLYLSSDFTEIKQITDKVYVLNKGQVVNVHETNLVSESTLLYEASGGLGDAI